MRLEAVVLLCCVALCVSALRHDEQNREEFKKRRRRSVMRNIQTMGQLRKERQRPMNNVEDDPLYNRLYKRPEGATISEMFSLCDPVTLHQFEKKHHSKMRTWTRTPHLEDVHRVKCDVYSRLHQCVEGATLPANTWSCMHAHCGDQQLTHFIERASRDHKKNTCRNVTTDDGKIRCVFERLHAARSCGELRHVCEAHPYHEGPAAEVCGRHGPRAGRGQAGEHQEADQAEGPHGHRMKRGLSRRDRSSARTEGRLLHHKVERSQWPAKFLH